MSLSLVICFLVGNFKQKILITALKLAKNVQKISQRLRENVNNDFSIEFQTIEM